MKFALSVIIVIGLVAGGAAYYTVYVSADPPTHFRTVPIARGNLLSTIAATGTIEPEELVDIGAQVNGRIKDFGIDTSELNGRKIEEVGADELAQMKRLDFCSVVHKGDILARIDESVYKAQLDQAKAACTRARADLEQLKAKRLQAEQDRKRAEKLRSINDIPGAIGPIKGIADSDYDLAVANHEVAKANVSVGEAMLQQNMAALQMAQQNYDYTIIPSPVDGVIIARRMNIGQTVVSSLNAPSIFLIGKDLRKMQVWASVNEAYIGQIRSRSDMPVRFTVDAFPGETFQGKVVQIRLNATMTQNVVTYTVVIAFDNNDLKLIPYLSANLQFELDERKDVLQVPNAALRWKPRLAQVVPELREEIAPTLAGKSDDRDAQNADRSPTEQKQAKPNKDLSDQSRLWIIDGKYVRPIEVQVGISDGSQTEVSGDEVKEGMKVVMGESRGNNLADGDTTNPFAPRLFRGGGGRGGGGGGGGGGRGGRGG